MAINMGHKYVETVNFTDSTVRFELLDDGSIRVLINHGRLTAAEALIDPADAANVLRWFDIKADDRG